MITLCLPPFFLFLSLGKHAFDLSILLERKCQSLDHTTKVPPPPPHDPLFLLFSVTFYFFHTYLVSKFYAFPFCSFCLFVCFLVHSFIPARSTQGSPFGCCLFFHFSCLFQRSLALHCATLALSTIPIFFFCFCFSLEPASFFFFSFFYALVLCVSLL